MAHHSLPPGTTSREKQRVELGQTLYYYGGRKQLGGDVLYWAGSKTQMLRLVTPANTLG